MNYTKKDGTVVNGSSVYVGEERKNDEKVQGMVTHSVWVSLVDGQTLASNIGVGATVDIEYNRFGRLQFC